MITILTLMELSREMRRGELAEKSATLDKEKSGALDQFDLENGLAK